VKFRHPWRWFHFRIYSLGDAHYFGFTVSPTLPEGMSLQIGLWWWTAHVDIVIGVRERQQ
jgi:hypothetical protein